MPNPSRGKALFLYSDSSGHGQVNRHFDVILSRLRALYATVDAFETASPEEGARRARDACGVYEALVFSGGDGTFNNIITALLGQKDAPTLGYINSGTMGDIGRNFGIGSSYRSALRAIEGGYTSGFDIGKVNGKTFTYMAAVGAFADIAYLTKRSYKKRIGKIAYYFKAVGEALVPKAVACHIEADGQSYDLKVPFILCLSGKNVGGFRVNGRHSSIHDGKFELYLTKPGLFNGLLHYLFFKVRTTQIVASSFRIEVGYPLPWCLDGEAGPIGSVTIEAADSGLRVFCAKKRAEKA